MKTSRVKLALLAGLAVFAVNSGVAMAASDSAGGGDDHAVIHFGYTFLMFAVVLVAGKLGNIVEKFGAPGVLGELGAGVVLSALGYFGLGIVADINHSEVIQFIAQFGALLLLFSIGLESNIGEMKKVGVNALGVALIGVIVPFGLGTYVLAEIFYGDASQSAKLFLGASLVATSVGITASVFKGLGIMKKRAAQTVIGAAIIDDVLGLMVLGIVSAIAAGGDVTTGDVGVVALKSFGFLAGSIVLGGMFAPAISKFFSAIHSGIGMKLSVAVAFALSFGYLAEKFGLEPIIGAFAAGLFLDHVHFGSFADPEFVVGLKGIAMKDKDDKAKLSRVISHHKETHIEDLIASLSLVFVPIFFVATGASIDFGSLLDPKLYLIAGAISIVAILGKLVSGFAAKGDRREQLLVGMSMVPRGEVGLIFAATGAAVGALDEELFSVIVLVVVMTTVVAPPLIKRLAQG